MPNSYQSTFTGQHNDNYDARISAVEAYGNRITDLETFRQTFLNMVYPIGSIYISMNTTDPGTLFGGTWERICGRFLLGCGGSGAGTNTFSDFGVLAAGQETWFADFSPGSKGGEFFHTLNLHELPSHAHAQFVTANKNTGGTGIRQDWDQDASGLTAYAQGISTGAAGESGWHNNMPPFITVAMWKRTA